MVSWMVHKFGGTSVAGSDRYKNVAKIIQNEPGDRKAIVVSAMSKVTDSLIELCELAKNQNKTYLEKLEVLRQKHLDVVQEIVSPELSNKLSEIIISDFKDISEILRSIWLLRSTTEKTVEFISGFGEIWSAQILNAHLNSIGIASSWLDAREVLFVSNNETGVIVEWPTSQAKINAWIENCKTSYLIITGFVATSMGDKTPTTLKRNGSDYSGSIFAALLNAPEITIWTDVDGVLSADPRLVPDAVVLEDLSYAEVTELAYFGAKVVHPSTMTPAIQKNIPIYIRNTFNPTARGTKIHKTSDSKNPIKGFSTIEKVSLINVEGTGMMGVPGIAQRLFGALREVSVSVIMISQASSEHSICIAIPTNQTTIAKNSIEKAFALEIQQGFIQDVSIQTECSILAAVGDNMANQAGLAGKFLGALGMAQVSVMAIAQGSSERNISVVVSASDAIRGLRSVHAAFFLSDFTLSIGIVGMGGIGTTFLNQLQEHSKKLRSEFKIDLRVRGLANSTSMALSDKHSSFTNSSNFKLDTPWNLNHFIEHIKPDHLPHAVIVDCSASETTSDLYPELFHKGIHIITPNKKGNTKSIDFYKKLKMTSSANRAHYLYETTVGAGLPIINTLRELIRTGDRIISIEGVFSGTLSFIFNSFSETNSFSKVVLDAKAKGYTEPDPRDDLSGLDVARKLVILAREMGLTIELADVKIDPLLDDSLLQINTEEFLTQLPKMDKKMLQLLTEAKNQGQVLKYVGQINNQGKALVTLKKYPIDHSFARLSKTDNIVAFQTERYFEQPLVVQGPGAGREVTAGGVFADLLRLCSYLGAPL